MEYTLVYRSLTTDTRLLPRSVLYSPKPSHLAWNLEFCTQDPFDFLYLDESAVRLAPRSEPQRMNILQARGSKGQGYKPRDYPPNPFSLFHQFFEQFLHL